MRGRLGDDLEQAGDQSRPCWEVALLLLAVTAALFTFIFHRFLSAGWLLSAWLPSALVGLSALAVVGVALKRGAPLLHGEQLPRIIWLVAALSATAAWFFWAGRQVDWGDYLVHHHHALQLSLGRAEPSRHYIDAPHFYPPLAHHILALLHRLSGLSLYRVYALLTVALSALTPPLLWRLGRRWGLGKGAALFFALAVSLYGGLAATGSATHALPALSSLLHSLAEISVSSSRS